MNTVESFDMMEKLLPDIVELLADPAIAEFKETARNERVKSSEVIAGLLPVFITKHRNATLRIIAEVSGKTVDEVKKQPLADTIEDFKFSDEVYSFFGSCLRLVLRA